MLMLLLVRPQHSLLQHQFDSNQRLMSLCYQQSILMLHNNLQLERDKDVQELNGSLQKLLHSKLFLQILQIGLRYHL